VELLQTTDAHDAAQKLLQNQEQAEKDKEQRHQQQMKREFGEWMRNVRRRQLLKHIDPKLLARVKSKVRSHTAPPAQPLPSTLPIYLAAACALCLRLSAGVTD
jgi:hypothetical protein